METVLGLLGVVAVIAFVISLAAGVTYLVVRLSPTREAKNDTEPTSSSSSSGVS